MPAVEKIVAGIFTGSKGKFIRHVRLTEIPECTTVMLEPFSQQDQLCGTVMTKAGFAGAESTQAGVGAPENVADLTCRDDSFVAQQTGDDMKLVIQGIDLFENG